MRPITLIATAFGPFAGRQIIDFTALGTRSFFLIEGPIGSGKTSILDAICYALYGVSSGAERKDSDLRSHHARPDLLTTVSFDFELGSGKGARRYRIERTPTQTRQAQRGDTRPVTVQTSVTLTQINAFGQPIDTPRTGVRDVNARVEELIGISAEQFRQVIVLPQGKFREFLASDSAKRREVLEKLFGTEIFRLIEDELGAAAKASDQAVAQAKIALDVILKPRGVETVEALKVARDARAAEAVTTRQEATAAIARATAADEAVVAGTNAVRLIAERDDANAAVATLEGERPARAADRNRLDAGRRAMPVGPVDLQLAEARTRRDTAAQDLAARRLAATAALEALEVARARLATEEARKPEREAATQRVQELDRLTQAVANLATLRVAFTEAQTAATTANDAVTAAESHATATATALADLLARIGTLREGAAKLDGARAVAEAVARQLQSRNDFEANRATLATAVTSRDAAQIQATRATEARAALEARITDLRVRAATRDFAPQTVAGIATALKARQALDTDRATLTQAIGAREAAAASHATAVTTLEAARTDRDATFHVWTAGLAGRLATNLAEGDACPVCGSEHHPARATGADLMTDDHLEAADGALKSAADAERRAAEAVASRQAEVHALEGKVATATEALGDDATVPLADLQGRKAQADTDLGAVDAATAELAGAEAGLDAARTAERDATQASDGARTAVTDLEARVGEATRTLGDDATVPLADLQRRKAQADADFQAATQATADLADATGREPAARQADTDAQTRTGQAREAASQAHSTLTEASTRVEVAASGVPEDLATAEALDGARVAATNLITTLEAAYNEATAQERAADGANLTAAAATRAAEATDADRARELSQAVEALDQSVRAAGFASVDEWRAAVLAPGVIAEIEAHLATFDATLVAAQIRAASAREAAAQTVAPNMDALTAAATAAATARDVANETAAVVEADARALEAEVARADIAARTVDEARSHHQRVSRIADTARGTTAGLSAGQKISFRSYVLARVLDQVLDEATRRLLKVSQGRYEVRRRLEATNKRSQAGLDIEILDRYTGQARDARTLSGGESFQASLSLAFGLSDVVQQHVGGVHLDCTFVDEGFGSLDPEALENALAMLKELQVNGRLVGIISHVGDLRQHIDARLTLTRTPNGSTAAFHL